jgi:hypothetical protein
VAKARKSIDSRLVLPNGFLLHLRVWEVPEPVPPSEHRFKYSLFYGWPAERIVLYDNERGKGDHKHIRGVEMPYIFTTRDRLIEDFLADVRAVQAKEEGG